MGMNEVDADLPLIQRGESSALDSSESSPPSLPAPGARSPFERLIALIVRICMTVAVIYLGMTAFSLGSRRGWVSPAMMLDVLHQTIWYVLVAAFMAAVIGLAAAMARRRRLAKYRPPWLERRGGANDGAGTESGLPEGVGGSLSPRRQRSRFRRLAVRVPIALAICFGTGAYLGWVVDTRLADAIAAADRDDPHWRLKDLFANRTSVPEAENAALVVMRAVALLPERWPLSPLPREGDRAQPFDDAKHALDRLKEVPDNLRLDDSLADILRTEIKRLEGAVKLGRSLTADRRGQHELAPAPRPFETLLPGIQPTRAMASLMAADGAIRGQDGDVDGALDSCGAILGAGGSLGDEPFLISQLVRMIISGVALKAAHRAVAQGEPTDAALGRLQAELENQLAEPHMVYGLRGERATLVETIRQIGAGEVTIAELAGKASPLDRNGARAPVAPWAKLWYDYQQAIALDWMNQAMAVARAPVATRPVRWIEWNATLSRAEKTWLGTYAALLPLKLFPNVYSAGYSEARLQSELGATIILLTAERHRRKTGDWPQSIAAIDRSFLAREPLDPFSGNSFHLEHRDGQFLIYSIGANRKDEHGAFNVKEYVKGRHDDFGAIGWDIRLRSQAPANDTAVHRETANPH